MKQKWRMCVFGRTRTGASVFVFRISKMSRFLSFPRTLSGFPFSFLPFRYFSLFFSSFSHSPRPKNARVCLPHFQIFFLFLPLVAFLSKKLLPCPTNRRKIYGKTLHFMKLDASHNAHRNGREKRIHYEKTQKSTTNTRDNNQQNFGYRNQLALPTFFLGGTETKDSKRCRLAMQSLRMFSNLRN